jgi:hypothetical protein
MTNAPESLVAVTPSTGRIAGIVLLVAAILTIVAMAHHPSEIESGGTGMGMTLGGLVHATMIVLLGANLWGLAIFTLRQTPTGWGLAGILAYGLSFVGNVIAAVINGFIVPAIAAQVDRAQSGDLFVLLWQSNQAAAQLGIYAASAAIFFWSLGLLKRRNTADFIVGSLGMLAASVPSMALYTGMIRLNVDGAFMAYGVQAAWTGLVGLQMLLRRV